MRLGPYSRNSTVSLFSRIVFGVVLNSPSALPQIPVGQAGSSISRSYVPLDLGPIAFFNSTCTISINGQGQIAFTRPSGQSLLWENGKLQPLTGLSGVCDLNAREEVVGWVQGSPHRTAVIWCAGEVIPLGVGVLESLALGVNESGQVIGQYRVDDGGSTDRAFLWSQGGVRELVGLGGTDMIPADLNLFGQIVGGAKTPLEVTHAFLWTRGRMNDLSNLPGIFGESVALAINDYGVVVGITRPPFGNGLLPFIFKSGTIHPLPTLPDTTETSPLAINLHSQIVGTSRAGTEERAIFIEGGRAYDLNDLVIPDAEPWELLGATDINDRGEIVGYGFHGGRFVGFLLRPTGSASPPSRLAQR